MQVNSDKANPVASDAVGPLNALEAERYVEELRTFSFEQMGSANWVTQHEWLQQLNAQAHVNASQQRDEFVVEALLLHEKMPLLIRELVACELWKLNVFPLLKGHLEKHNSVKGYLLCYHEAVLSNLLETTLFHEDAAEAAGDLIVELADYCHRKLVWLMNYRGGPTPVMRDPEARKQQVMKETEEEYLAKQTECIDLSSALYALSITRFLAERLPKLPLALCTRLLDTYDILMVLAPLLERKPWEHTAADGTLHRFEQGQWVPCGADARRSMAKSEAQVRASHHQEWLFPAETGASAAMPCVPCYAVLCRRGSPCTR